MQFLQKKIWKYWFFTHSYWSVMSHEAPLLPPEAPPVRDWDDALTQTICPRWGPGAGWHHPLPSDPPRKNPALINNKKPNGAKPPPAKPTNGGRPEDHRQVIAKEQSAHFIYLSPAQIRQNLREKTGRQNDCTHLKTLWTLFLSMQSA